MQISSINEIIQGELLNSPAVSFIYNVKTDVKKVLEGDLFFVLNHKDIPKAIAQGAFAIVVEKKSTITDEEIAWIEVDSIYSAITRYLRYKLSYLELEAYSCDDVSYELLKLFSNQLLQTRKIWLFSNDISRVLYYIDELKNGDTLISKDSEMLNRLYPKNENFNSTTYTIKNLIEHSLFETSFSYKKHFFSHIKLSSLFINQFLQVYTFINAPIDLNKLKRVNYFKPIFIDKFFNFCEYGKSDKFILIQEKKSLARSELNYIYKKYKYAKTVVFTKESFTKNGFETYKINKLEEIFQLLKNISFNAIYIIGFEKNSVEELFKNNNSTSALL